MDATHSYDDHAKLQRFVNIKKSKGSYFVDTDGNVVLDMNCPLALGWNNDHLINARDSNLYDRFLQGRLDVSSLPPNDYVDLLRDNVMPVAPQGMTQVHFSDGSTTGANEAAISQAIMTYAMNHKRPYENLSVMGFEHGSHGQSVATLSCSDAFNNAENMPTYDWPVMEMPKMQYPLAKYEHQNAAEEDRCL